MYRAEIVGLITMIIRKTKNHSYKNEEKAKINVFIQIIVYCNCYLNVS